MALANADVNLNSSVTDTTAAGYGIIFDTAGNPVNYRLTGYSGNTFSLHGSLTLSEASVGGPPAMATAIMDPSLAAGGSIDTVHVEPNVDLAMPAGATVVPVNVTLDGVSASGQTPALTIYSGNSAPTYVYANGKGVLNIVGSVNYSNTLAEKQLGSSFEIENGTLVLTSIQTFENTGNLIIDSGAGLTIQNYGLLNKPNIVQVNGRLTSGGVNLTIQALGGSGSISLGSNYLEIQETSGDFSGTISGTGGLTIDGNLGLTKSNGYSGSTTVGSGATLFLKQAGSIGASRVLNSGVLDISNTTGGASVKSLSGPGAVRLGGQTLTLTDAGDSFTGNIQGSGGLTIAGGTETLTANNSYTGQTSVDTGATLKLSGSGALGGNGSVTDNGELNYTSGDTGSFGGKISGTGTVVIDGNSRATLSASNDYTGATTIGAGSTLLLSGSGSIGSSAVQDDGTLDISGTSAGASVGSIAGAGGVNLGGQTLSVSQAAGTLGGIIQGSGGLSIAAGTETLTGNNTYTGLTTIDSSATLALSGSGSFQVQSKLLDNGTLAFENADRTWSASIAGSGGVTVDGGSATLSAANSYTGATMITAGSTLNLSGAGSITASTVGDDGVLDISGAGGASSVMVLAGSGHVNLGANTLKVSQAAGDLSGGISGTGGLDIDAGKQTLSGANTYTGATSIGSSATLALSGTGSLGSSPVADGGTLDISGTSAGATVAGLSGSGGVSLGGQTLRLGNGGGNILGGVITGSGGVSLLAGRQILTGTNTYTGTTTIDSGATLALSGTGSLGASPVADAGTLDIADTTAGASVGSIAGAGEVSLGTQTLTVTQAAGTLAGTIAGSGGLTIAGGTETLTGNSVYTGPTTIDSGATLALSGTGSLANPSRLVDNGTLAFEHAERTWSASITGGGGVTVDGGHASLSAVNGYAGVTTIISGSTLDLVDSGSIAQSPVADAGTLDISGTTAGASVGSIAGAGGVNLGAQTLSVTQASGTFAGTIQGTGGLNIAGGSEILDAAAAYTGATSIGRGARLALGSSGSLAGTPVVADGALDVSGADVALDIPTLSGSGAVNLGGNELVLSRASGVFSGQIAGQAGLRLLAGQETLGGTDTYTGDTQVQGGTLVLGNQAMLASRLLVQAAGGVRTQGDARVAQDLDNSGDLILTQDSAVSPALSVAGSYTQASNATLTVDIAPASNARLEVLGRQLNLGGHLVIAAAPGKYLRHSYLLVDAPASTSLNGTFADWQVQGLAPGDYQFSLQYLSDPQVIFSLVALHAFSGSSQTPNENNLGTALDSLIPTAGPGLLARLQALFGQDSVARALEAIDGEVYSETPGWLLQGTGREWSRLFDRLGMGQGGDAPDPRQRSFAFITGSRGQLLGDGNALGLDESSSGLTIGHQRRVGPWMLGAAAGTLELGATRHVIGDGATTQLYRGGVFAGRDLGRMRVGSLLGYSGGRVHYGSAERDARIWTWQSRLDRSFALRSGDVLTPIAGLDLQHLRLSAARESDPVLGLVVPRQSAYTLSMLGALRVTRPVSWRDSVGTLNASLGVRHWFRRPPSELRFGFTGIEGLQFSDSGVASSRNVLEATLGAQAKLRRNLEAQLSWQASIGHSLRENQLQARLSWSF